MPLATPLPARSCSFPHVLTKACDLLFPCSQGSTSWASGWPIPTWSRCSPRARSAASLSRPTTNQFGPNITKDEATANSAAWYEIDPTEADLGAALDALPTAQWDDETTLEPASTPGSSTPGSSSSHAATPPGRGRGAGRGRGRGQ